MIKKNIDINIKKNFNNAKKIEKLILKEKNLKEKLNLLKFLSNYYSSYTTGVYYSEFIEKELKELSKLIRWEKKTENKYKKKSVLHIMSCAYNSGGHTRVVANWIDFDDTRNYSVLINHPEFSEIPTWLEKSIEKSGGKIILNEQKDDFDKVKFLLNESMKYEKIVLHIHNDDIIPNIAFSNKKWNKEIYLYNHSDHKFWLGISISDIILELSSDGLNLSKVKRQDKESFILSIPIQENIIKVNKNIEINKKIKENFNLPHNSKVIISMASNYKYNSTSDYNFQKFAEKVCEIDKNIYFLIIGANNKDKKWKMVNRKTNGKIRAEGIIDKESVKEYMSIAEIYIDSFPLNSYTCMLEAISNDIPSMSLITPISNLDSIKKFKYSSEDQILKKIDKLVNDKKLEGVENSKLEIENIHFKKKWCENLEKVFLLKVEHSTEIKKSLEYEINNYERFLYEVNHFNERFSIRMILKLSLLNIFKILFICRKDIKKIINSFLIK